MLADRKKKQRITADPQNMGWREDQDNFGMKMLQKMGWKEGKGLGAREDGVVEHLKVSLKESTTSGIGMAKGDPALERYQQLDTFDQLLQSLNENIDQSEQEEKKRKKSHKSTDQESRKKKEKDLSTESESKSINIKEPTRRLAHRSKFIRNKRVSECSKESLAQILGKKESQ